MLKNIIIFDRKCRKLLEIRIQMYYNNDGGVIHEGSNFEIDR